MFSEKVALALASILNGVAIERGLKPQNSGNLFDDLEAHALTLTGNHRAAGTATVAKLQAAAGGPDSGSELLAFYQSTQNDPVARAQFLARNEKALRELVATGNSSAKPAPSVESVLIQYNALTDPQQRAAFVAKHEAELRAIASSN